MKEPLLPYELNKKIYIKGASINFYPQSCTQE